MFVLLDTGVGIQNVNKNEAYKEKWINTTYDITPYHSTYYAVKSFGNTWYIK